MREAWSERIERHYAIRLSPDLRAWLDEETWEHRAGGEFNHRLTPEQLIAPPPGTIWPGFMLPDTLPLVGNLYGDWLCLRAADDGTVAEIVRWSHNGGDWLPCGRNLAEALLYDAACYAESCQRAEPGHAGPAAIEVVLASRWAAAWLEPERRPATGSWFRCGPRAVDARGELLRARVAEIAVHRDRAAGYLHSRLSQLATPELASRFNVSWTRDFVRWLFDSTLIDAAVRQRLSDEVGVEPGPLTAQDWDLAEAEASRVCELRSDQAWAFDIAGWAAERRGAMPLAIQRYATGLSASLFTDETVTFRSHWFDDGFGKFAAFRLAALRDEVPPATRDDPYLRLFWDDDAKSLRHRVCEHWLRIATDCERQSRHGEAYRAYYSAGWDCGIVEPACVARILDGLHRSAERAGWDARRRIADLHRQCLIDWEI